MQSKIVDLLGDVPRAELLAKRFAERHPSQAARILGRPPVYLAAVKPEAETVKELPQEMPELGEIPPEMKAGIAAYIKRTVDEMLAERRKQIQLSSSPIDLSVRPTVKQVVEIVALIADLPVSEFTSPRRARRIAWPRQIAMALVRQVLPSLSYPQIGKLFGKRDHTTVMHALRKTEWHMEQQQEMAQLYRRARAAIEAKWPESFK